MSRGLLESRSLNLLLDIRQPQAYLALHPAAAMASEMGIEVDWLPVVVAPLKAPTAPQSGDDRGVRHRRARAEAIAREIDTYARVQGLAIRDYYRDPDPTELNLAWLWLREAHPDRVFEFLAEAFRAYWNLELEIGKVASIVAMLDALPGIRNAEADFLSWRVDAGRQRAEELATVIAERGLTRSPCYVIEDEVFVGRQHLPMIRWVLGGRAGRGPI